MLNFYSFVGGKALDDCYLCTGGFYCDEEGLSEPYKLCDGGWLDKTPLF